MNVNVEQVWLDYRDSLKSFLHSRVSDPDEVDDLLQDVLIKTHRNLPTLRDDERIEPWLFQIANNAIIDFYRKRGRDRTVDAEDLWYGESDTTIREDLSKCIEPFIHALPAESAQLLSEVDLAGRSQKEYAKHLGVSYSTLKSRVKKSRSELRHLFDRCCTFTVDRSGNLVDFDPRSGICEDC